MEGSKWTEMDGKWRRTRSSVMQQMGELDAQLLVNNDALEAILCGLGIAEAELSRHKDLPETTSVIKKTKATLPSMVAGIATLRASIDHLRRFVVHETTSHHRSMTEGMSVEELALIAEMNPFVPCDGDDD